MAIPYSGDSLQADKRKRMLNEIFLCLFTCTYKFYRVYLHAESRTIIFLLIHLVRTSLLGRKIIRELNDTFINPLKTTRL